MKIKTPILTVLINFNTDELTKECVGSLKKSTVPTHVIIVDNSSINTNLKKFYEGDSSVSVLLSKFNVGFGNANNIAIQYANENIEYEYMFILNNDTLVEANTLQKLIQNFTNDNIILTTCLIVYSDEPDLVWYGGGYISSNPRPTIIGQNQKINEEVKTTKLCTFASGCAMMFKKQGITDLVGFDTRFFMYVEDVELCFRIRKLNKLIQYDGSTKIFHRVNASIGNSEFKGLNINNPNISFHLYHKLKNTLLTMNMHLTGFKYFVFIFKYFLFIFSKLIQLLIHGKWSLTLVIFKAIYNYNREKKLHS